MSASNIELVTKAPVGAAAVSAAAISGRTRLYGIYYTCTATASSFEIRNGAADTDTSLITIYTPAAAGQYEIDIPDGGALFSAGAFIDAADVQITSVTLVYAGGAAA